MPFVRRDLHEKVCLLIERIVGCPAKSIMGHEHWRELGINSLDLLALAVDCETTFDIAIPDGELPEIRTVSDLVEYLQKATFGSER